MRFRFWKKRPSAGVASPQPRSGSETSHVGSARARDPEAGKALRLLANRYPSFVFAGRSSPFGYGSPANPKPAVDRTPPKLFSPQMMARIGENLRRIEPYPLVNVFPFPKNPVSTPAQARYEFFHRHPVYVEGTGYSSDERVDRKFTSAYREAEAGMQREGSAADITINSFDARSVLMSDVQLLQGDLAVRLRSVHAFGLDMNSRDRDFLFGSGEWLSGAIIEPGQAGGGRARRIAEETCSLMLEAVAKAAVHRVPANVSVHVRMPPIGMNQLALAGGSENSDEMIKFYVRTLREKFLSARWQLPPSVTLCVSDDYTYELLERLGLTDPTPSGSFRVEGPGCDLLDVGGGGRAGVEGEAAGGYSGPPINIAPEGEPEKLMRTVRVNLDLGSGAGPVDIDAMLVIVSPWSTHGWIGNAMAQNRNEDGRFVADSRGDNKDLLNASFWMNATMLLGPLDRIRVIDSTAEPSPRGEAEAAASEVFASEPQAKEAEAARPQVSPLQNQLALAMADQF